MPKEDILAFNTTQEYTTQLSLFDQSCQQEGKWWYVRILLFLILCLSQGSVATRCRCGGKYDIVVWQIYCTDESNSEKVSKIGQHLSKLWHVFLWPTVYTAIVRGIFVLYSNEEVLQRANTSRNLLKLLLTDKYDLWDTSWERVGLFFSFFYSFCLFRVVD